VTDLLTRKAPVERPTGARESRPRTIWIIVLVVALVAGFGAWLALRDTGPSEPPAFLSDCGTVMKAEGSTRLRVLLVGDSLMQQPQCELARALTPRGVETHMHAAAGSGLLIGAVNWVKLFDRLLAAVHPDVVLATFVGNYIGPPLRDFAGNPVQPDTPLFFALWQQRATELSKSARGAGAKLFWVQPPPVRDSSRGATLFDGYTKLGDPTLPSGAALAGPDGEWVESIPACGGGQALRTPDGVHLTPFGAHVFALAVARDLSAALHLPPVAPAC
jgi:uncharacterized protein